jgi:YHS domain-containing protein
MPGNLCTSVIVLAATGLGMFTMTLGPSDEAATERSVTPVNVSDGVALNGYDPVSYFVDEEPVEGTSCLEIEHAGVAYRFASLENRDRFIEDPSAYVPQLGGYSVFGMAKGKRYDVSPKTWDIIDGKLYMSRNRKVRELWQANTEGYINQAESHWRAQHAP